MSSRFRFEGLQIWQTGAELSIPLFRVADQLEGTKLFRFSGQLKGSVLRITNNLAEGSGSTSDKAKNRDESEQKNAKRTKRANFKLNPTPPKGERMTESMASQVACFLSFVFSCSNFIFLSRIKNFSSI
jgi:hypothetical protein